MDECKGFL